MEKINNAALSNDGVYDLRKDKKDKRTGITLDDLMKEERASNKEKYRTQIHKVREGAAISNKITSVRQNGGRTM